MPLSRTTSRTTSRTLATAVASAFVLAGITACSRDEPERATTAPSTTTTEVATTTTTARPPRSTTSTSRPTTTTSPTTTTVATTPAATDVPSPPPVTTTPPSPPGYPATIAPIDAATAATMTGSSWRAGCPVPLSSLRLLTLPYVGFDGATHRGRLVVHADAAAGIVQVFRNLFFGRFPIAQMVLVDAYGADDDRSVLANNTSAFNCRPVTGGGGWSQHSYGRAIDINPLQNPYVYSNGSVMDPAAAKYRDRSLQLPGMIHAADGVVAAFGAVGWGWGGTFVSIKDYQHFSATGG